MSIPMASFGYTSLKVLHYTHTHTEYRKIYIHMKYMYISTLCVSILIYNI